MLVLTHIRDRMPLHSNYTLVYAASLATEVECQLWEEFKKHLDKLAKKFIDNATSKLRENMARNVSKKRTVLEEDLTVNIKLGDNIEQDLEKDSRGFQVIIESNTALLHFFSLLNDPRLSPCPSL
ncbi:hypothetical protein WN943_028695 [Citrus x changshan-huyou]